MQQNGLQQLLEGASGTICGMVVFIAQLLERNVRYLHQPSVTVTSQGK
jgi:hypothetical protein